MAIPALLALLVALFAPQVLGDGDSYWHVAAGQWMLDHHQVIHTDSFSFTFTGKPWDTHEWLSEVVMALAFRAEGWAGVVGLTGAAAAATIGLTAQRLGRWLDPIGAVLGLALVAACLAPNLLARPHFLALPFLVLWTGALLDARAGNKAPSLWWLPLMILWANAHGSFLFGLALICPFALEALIAEPKAWRATVKDWGLFGVGSGLAALLTPHGLEGLLFPLKLGAMGSLASIVEWRSPDFQHLPPVEIALLAGLYILLSRGVKVPPIRLILLLVLLYMTLGHVRHETLLVLIGAPLIAELIGQRKAPQPAPAQSVGLATVCAVLAAALLLAGRLMLPATSGDSAVSPVSALAHVPQTLRRQPVLNSYDLGGYLIFRGVKTFIDGRTDMFGDEFNARYDAIMRPNKAALAKAVQDYGITWTFLSPSSPLVPLLESSPEWRRLYADRYAVIDVRH
ncbi:MAG TPA: hypothetical protein VG960_03525 [Caulobacteraceae bacterium]|nr:hypothetical protein [Caulobacteraceae bacterium]